MAASLELAISAIRSGRKEEGRQLLNLLIQQNPNDEKAWLWMSSVVELDEQRARCLYHVLAINPNSDIARRGLQVLGIVVSDSRPVKVPRESRPIKIPKPTPKTGTAAERRPFLIDPQTITDELPFTPMQSPFRAGPQASPSALEIKVDEKTGDKQAAAVAHTLTQSEENWPKPVAQNSVRPDPVAYSPEQIEPSENRSEPVPVVRSPQVQQPSEPVPVVHSNVSPDLALQPQSQPAVVSVPVVSPNPAMPISSSAALPGQSSAAPDTGPLNPLGQPYAQSLPSGPVSQQPSGGMVISPQVPADTRPSQPMPVVHPHYGIEVPQSNYTPYYPPTGQATTATQGPASAQNPVEFAGTTVRVPTHHPLQAPLPALPMPQIHSNATLGMPVPDHNGQVQHPSEPVPVVQSVVPYGQVQATPSPQGMAFHSSSTMMMPTMPDLNPGIRPDTGPNSPVTASAMALHHSADRPEMTGNQMFSNVNVSAYGNHPEAEDEEGAEEVNILAVIIFGTLSVTALGGLGMLILLMFTTPAG